MEHLIFKRIFIITNKKQVFYNVFGVSGEGFGRKNFVMCVRAVVSNPFAIDPMIANEIKSQNTEGYADEANGGFFEVKSFREIELPKQN